MAEPSIFEFVQQARDFFDGPGHAKGAAEPASGDVIDVEPTTVEVVDSPKAETPPESSEAEPQRLGGFTIHVTPEHLRERVAWVVNQAESFHRALEEGEADEAFVAAWRVWYRDVLVWRRRVVASAANATKADYDRLDTILQRLEKWRDRWARDQKAAAKAKGNGLPWYVWAGIIVGGFYAARNVLGGLLVDMTS